MVKKLLARAHRILVMAAVACLAMTCLAAAANAAGDLQSLSKDPKNWPMAPRDYANTRYSALDQISTGNAGRLGLAWSFSVGTDRGQRAAARVAALALAAIGLAAQAPPSAHAADPPQLRVCAYANGLPYANRQRRGFENKLADFVAAQLREQLVYTWWPGSRGLIRHALDAGLCDVVIGVPSELGSIEATRAYYWSSYVFVSRSDRHLGNITSIKDSRLKHLKIGVQSIGGNRFYTPLARMLSASGSLDNVVGYPADDSSGPIPPGARIVAAVARGDVDIAAVWGPVAGYFARRSSVPLQIAPIGDYEMFSTRLPHFRLAAFQYDIAMGVRKGDDRLRDRLDRVIAARQPQITAMLQSFGVPLINPMRNLALAAPQDGTAE